jgi:hypothetical protein
MKIYHGNMQTKRYMSFGRENYEDLPWKLQTKRHMCFGRENYEDLPWKYADEEVYVFRQREL